MTLPRYIGLTGPNAAGKGVVADHLRDAHGFAVRSLSDVIRAEARRRGEEPVRDVLIAIGNELRGRHGPGALARLIRPELRPPAVVDSIRNPAEVAELRTLDGFVLIAVVAPEAVRFERSLVRARAGDPRTLEAFREREARENTSDPSCQQIDATRALADVTLENSGTLEDLRAAVDRLLDGTDGG